MEHEAATSHPSNPQSLATRVPINREMSDQLFSLVCLVHREQETDSLREIYWQGLKDFSMDQARAVAEAIVNETKFWPTPARLREMAGIPNLEERQAWEASEALDRVLERIRPASRNAAIRADFVAHIKTCLADDPITKTLEAFGGNDLEYAVTLLCQHPKMLRSTDEREPVGLEMNTVDVFKRHWLAAWKKVKGEK